MGQTGTNHLTIYGTDWYQAPNVYQTSAIFSVSPSVSTHIHVRTLISVFAFLIFHRPHSVGMVIDYELAVLLEALTCLLITVLSSSE